MELSFYLYTPQGERQKKENPVSFSWVTSADTPADSLKAVFLCEPSDIGKETAEIEVKSGSRRLFHGICDRRSICREQNGQTLVLWARSDGALLLDNEAIPQEYEQVSLEEIFDRHIRPYGFQNSLDSGGSLPFYRVEKGVSEWEAFAGFCRMAVRKTPYLNGAKVLFLSPGQGTKILLPQQTPLYSVEEITDRTGVISKALLRDANGKYTIGIENKQAKELGICRTRCVIPNSQRQWTQKDAEYRLIQSMRGRKRTEICVSGLFLWELGEQINLRQGELNLSGNIVSREWQFDRNGSKTKVILE